MPRSRVSLLAWTVALAFIIGSALIWIDRLNLYATPPDTEFPNLVERVLGTAAYRQAIWPVFLWTNLSFAFGFAAAVAFAFNVAAASGIAGGLPTFKSLVATGGVMGAISSIIPIGSVNAGVWLQYCDCGFKETEVVSQVWAQMVTQDIGDWLNRFASIVLAMALIALVRESRDVLPTMLRTLSYILAAILIVVPVLVTTELVSSVVPDLLSAAAGLVLIPVWAVGLGLFIDARGPRDLDRRETTA